MNTVPNLDAMSVSELTAFWKRYHRPSRKDAAKLIGDRRPGYTNLASALANYALNKTIAMGCRLEGKIATALTYEEHAELSYKRLPKDLRW